MSDSRFYKRKFAFTYRPKRRKVLMKKAPEVATTSKILPSPSPAVTASGKKLALGLLPLLRRLLPSSLLALTSVTTRKTTTW